MTDILAIDYHKLHTINKEYAGVAEALGELPCDTAQEEAWWADRLEAVSKVLKAANAEYREIKDAINRDGRRVDSAYRSNLEPVEKLKALCLKKLAGPAQRRLDEQADVELRLRNAAPGEALALLEELPDDVKVAGVSARTKWCFEVVDAEIVPASLKIVDECLVSRVLKLSVLESGRPPEIAGIRFYQQASVQRSARKKGG